jgi:hypothetical protein
MAVVCPPTAELGLPRLLARNNSAYRPVTDALALLERYADRD